MAIPFLKAKILLVDGDNNLLQEIKRALIKKDFTIELAVDGKEAIEKIKEFHPHLVILDLKIPSPGGVAVLKTLKQLKPNIEVIILTGSTCFKSYTECIENGAFSWVTKPLNIGSLIVTINSALAHTSIKNDSGSKPPKNGGINWSGN